MDIRKLAVIGAGQMGSGIAQVAAQSGLEVALVDAMPGAVEKALANIAKLLDRAVTKGTLAQPDRDAAFARLRGATLEDLGDCDFAVEAITENETVKRETFQRLDAALPARAVLASNTSSIPITRLAATTKRPTQVVGMHFMNPVPVMKLVEVIRGVQTGDATYAATITLAQRMGKTTVTSKDMPGFIVNRILIPMLNEACFALQDGLGTVKDIDTAMKLGLSHPMGAFELADFIGLDTCLFIAEVLHKGLGDDKYRPAPLLRQYVDAGWLGKKTKRGFYEY